MNVIVKSYYYTICSLEHFTREMYDDGYSIWKAYLFIVIFEMYWVDNLIDYLNVSDEIGFFGSFLSKIIEAFALSAINYYLIFSNSRWVKFQPEYNQLSTLAKFSVLGAFAFSSILAFVVWVIVS